MPDKKEILYPTTDGGSVYYKLAKEPETVEIIKEVLEEDKL